MDAALLALGMAWLGWWQPGPVVTAALRLASVWEVPIGPARVIGQNPVAIRGGGEVCAVQLQVPDAQVGQTGLCDAPLLVAGRPVGPRHHRVRVVQPGRVWLHLDGGCPAGDLVLAPAARPVAVQGLGDCPGRLVR